MQVENSRPSILCIGGLDPSGGAGLQADIEAIASCGGHALPIASCLTVQNSAQTFSVSSVSAHLIQQQVSALLEDMQIAACKIGVIPNQDVAEMIADILGQLPNIPVVYDPVISSSHGSQFSDTHTIGTIKENLLASVTVLTPNLDELNAFINEECDIVSKAKSLCQFGPQYILATGADDATEQVHNTLLTQDGIISEYQWPRLPNHYHGSGCTLSSALACYLSKSDDILHAVDKAQKFTWQTLKNAQQLGRGQWIPNRIKTIE